MEKLSSIQALRGVAVLLVVLLHLHSYEIRFFPQSILFGPWVLSGNSGVDLFFVISGFVMVYSTRAGSRPSTFLLRRFLRIYPLYWLLTAGFLAAALGLPASADWQRLSETSYLSAFLLLPQNGETPLIVAWTLVHEVYFYLVFGLLLLFPLRVLPVLLVAWASSVIGAHLLLAPESIQRSAYLRIAASPLTLEFISGALLCRMLQEHHRRLPEPILLGAVAAALLYIVAVTGEAPSEWQRLVWWGAPWLLVVYCMVSRPILPFIQRLLAVGDASYSIYLIHCPVISIVYRLLATCKGALPGTVLSGTALVLGAVAAVVAGSLCYRFVERPLHAYARKLAAAPAPRSLSGSVLAPQEAA